jgi:hypothetical protein
VYGAPDVRNHRPGGDPIDLTAPEDALLADGERVATETGARARTAPNRLNPMAAPPHRCGVLCGEGDTTG